MPGRQLLLSDGDDLGRMFSNPKPFTAWRSAASCAAAPLTVTVKVACTGLSRSLSSVAVQVTVVVPIGNADPEAGVHTTAGGVVSAERVAR